MSDQRLADKSGNTIGYIKTESDGKLKLTDKAGNTLGHYDPKSDRTTNKVGVVVGHGNLLTTLLPH